MITLNDENEDIFQEGVKDILKSVADIDVDKIKGTWNDADKGIYDKVKSVNDEALTKTNDTLSKVNKTMNNNRVNNASIIARAKNSVLQFPIYVTEGIRVNEAHIISKMFERVYTTLVQTVLSQNQIIDEEEANNLVFLKHFHTNLKESVDTLANKYYEAIDDVDKMMCESIFHSAQITENLFVEFRVIPTNNSTLIMENARLSNEPLHGFSYLKENDAAYDKYWDKLSPKEKEDLRNKDRQTIENGGKRTEEIQGEVPERIVTDVELARIAKEHNILYGSGTNKGKGNPDALGERMRNNKESYEINGQKIMVRKGKNGAWEYYLPGNKGKKLTTDSAKVVDKRFRDAVDAPKLLKDSDIKKINGMLPYTFEATFRLRTKQGLDRDVRYIIGVKSIMHLIRVKDLSEDLREIITGNIKSLQKVRYTTGEITFKDYYFNTKGLKADAAKHVNYNKRWLNTLKRLGEYNKMNGSLLKGGIHAITGGHVPIPNGTLILSQPEVTELANSTGIDLSLVSNVKRLAKALFLIGVVVINSTAGTMRVIFPDSDSSWDVQSLSSIDAELAKTDNSQLMKELNRMVNR